MFRVAILAATVALCSAALQWNKLENVEAQALYTFEDFVQEFERKYEGEEILLRKRLFEESLKEVLIHNANSAKHGHTKGINRFSDMTAEEKSAFLGYHKGMSRSMKFEETTAPMVGDLPSEVDWRKKGVISAVKNQGQCGSCWAFATTEEVESFVAINTGKLPVLAPQQLVSCAPNPNQCGGTGGCEGSIPEVGFQYLQEAGMATEAEYPYQGRDSQCKYEKSMAKAHIGGFVKVASNNYTAVMQAIAEKGPLAIAVQASTWFSYSRGIFKADQCSKSNTDIDHAVQVVGYGTDNGQDYWIVRNSWGGSWGEEGFIRLERNSNPPCTPDKSPADGTGCKGGPKEVTVCGTCGILYDTCYPTGAQMA